MPDSPLDDNPPSPGARQPTLAPSARERAIAQLTEGFAQDHLTLEEFEHRCAAAYAATTVGELAALTRDLALPAQESIAVTGAIPSAARLSAVFSSIDRGGIVDVPKQLMLRVFAGNIELDFSHARFAPGVTEIHVRSFMGNIELKLPPGVEVENHGSALLGNFETRVTGYTSTRRSRSIVRLLGRVVMSSVSVSN